MGSRPIPGVYEDLPPPVADKPLRDDIAGVIGLTRRGPVDRAVLVESWESFVATFGDRADNVATPDAVLGFFVNGGRSAYVVRVLDRDQASSARAECKALQLTDPVPAPPQAPPSIVAAPLPVAKPAVPQARIRLPFRIPASLRPRRGPMLPATLPLRLPPPPQKPTPSPLPPSGTPPALHPVWCAAQSGIEDRGAWANGIRCTLHFTIRELLPRPEQDQLPDDQLRVQPSGEGSQSWGRSPVAPGSLLWLPERKLFAAVQSVRQVPDRSTPERALLPPPLLLLLDRALVLRAPDRVMIVEATLDVQGSSGHERYEGLGLCVGHPRYLPEVLRASSRLVKLEIPGSTPVLYPLGLSPVQGMRMPADGSEVAILGTPATASAPTAGKTNEGKDGLLTVKREHFFGADYDEEVPEKARGLSCLYPLADVSLVMMPDLVLPGTSLDDSRLSLPAPPPPCKRPSWVCGTVDSQQQQQHVPEPVRPPALIDPLQGGTQTMEDLINHQLLLVRECTRLGDRTALLCPPPSATPRDAVLWRSRFNSAFAAAYYPWLRFGDAVTHPPVRLVPPVGVAAGLIARSEVLFGVGRAPANLSARFCSGLATPIDDNDWARLHEVSLSIFRQLPTEVRLLGARTLSSNIEYRYLHVRRLITHIKRALFARMQWVVFENNIPAVRARLRRDIDARVLRPLFNRGAFAGDAPETSYFIRCDEVLNPRQGTDQGILLCEIGVAPALPSEYIVFRLSATRNEGLSVGEGV